jgi:hypothetical protein
MAGSSQLNGILRAMAPNDREPRGQGCPQVLLQRCAMVELVSIILSFGNATDDA